MRLKPTDWTALFFDKLSDLMGLHIQYASKSPGFFRAQLGHYGLLAICEDDTDCSVWLLDADGRTNGPIWAGSPSQNTALIAAAESNRAIDAMPRGMSFAMWPPIGRDLELEEQVNSAWQSVQERIDATQVRSENPSNVEIAIESVWRFIDRLLECGRLAEYIEPFKMQAADLIRSKYDPK